MGRSLEDRGGRELGGRDVWGLARSRAATNEPTWLEPDKTRPHGQTLSAHHNAARLVSGVHGQGAETSSGIDLRCGSAAMRDVVGTLQLSMSSIRPLTLFLQLPQTSFRLKSQVI